MPAIGPPELIIILVIALLILGPGKLPDVGAALGRSIREFRRASSDIQDASRIDAPPAGRPTTTPTSASPAAPPTQPTPAAPPAEARSDPRTETRTEPTPEPER